MTISQTTQELLKAHAGRGVSNDPELLTQKQNQAASEHVNKAEARAGRGRACLFCRTKTQTCTSRLRVILGAVVFDLRRALAGWQAYGPRALRPAGRRREGRLSLAVAQRKLTRDGGAARRPLQRRRGRARPGQDRNASGAGAQHRRESPGEQAWPSALWPRLRARLDGAHQRSRTKLLRRDVPISSERLARRRGPPRRRSSGRPPCAISSRPRIAAGEAGGRRPQKRNPAAPQAGPRPLITSGAAALKVVEAPPPVESYDGPDDDDIPF